MPEVRRGMKPCTPGAQPVTDRNDARRARRAGAANNAAAGFPPIHQFYPHGCRGGPLPGGGFMRCNMPERVATTTEATMTKSTGKSSSAIDATDTLATKAKRVVSMAAEKRPPRRR